MKSSLVLKTLITACSVVGVASVYSMQEEPFTSEVAYADTGVTVSTTTGSAVTIDPVNNGGSNGGSSGGSSSSGKLDDADSKVKNGTYGYKVSNSVTQNQVEKEIKDIIGDSSINVSISDWKVNPSSRKRLGSCTFTATYTDANGNTKQDSYYILIDSKGHAIHSDYTPYNPASYVPTSSNGAVPVIEDVTGFSGYSSEDYIESAIIATGSLANSSTEYGSSRGGMSYITTLEKNGAYVGTIAQIQMSDENKENTYNVGNVPDNAVNIYKYIEGTGKYVSIAGKVTLDKGNATFKENYGNGVYLFTVQPISSAFIANGWVQDAGNWKYLNSTGIAKGWQNIDNKWYYFDNTGSMVRNETIDGYAIGFDGTLS